MPVVTNTISGQMARGYVVPSGSLDTYRAARDDPSALTEVVCMGDSTTYGNDDSEGTIHSWVQRIRVRAASAGFASGGHGYFTPLDINNYASYSAALQDADGYPKLISRVGFADGAASTATNDNMVIDFTGTAVRLAIGTSGTNGKVGVTIDGGTETVYDGFRTLAESQIPYSVRQVLISGLTEGVHRMTIRNAGPSAIRQPVKKSGTGGVSDGGSLANGTTYEWAMTAVSANGEGTPVVIGSAAIAPAVSNIRTYSWQVDSDYGHTAYRMYRRVGTGAFEFIKQVTSAGAFAVTTMIDDGSVAPDPLTNPPAVNGLGNLSTQAADVHFDIIRSSGLVFHKNAGPGATTASTFDHVSGAAGTRQRTPGFLGLKNEAEAAVSISGALWRLPVGSKPLYRNAKLLVWQIGTNDSSSGSPNADGQTMTALNTFMENLAFGVRTARAAGADVILVSPVFNAAVTVAALHYQGRFKAAMLSIALAHGCAYVDFQEAMGYGFGSPDNPHLTIAQYDQQADYLWDNVLGV